MLALVGLTLTSIACAEGVDEDTADGKAAASERPKRNWTKNPAILEIDTAEDVYALSDIHGGYAELGRLLEGNGLIAGFDPSPAKVNAARWTGKKAIFVVAGDVVDKGAHSLASIDFLRALEPKAKAAGGRIVVTMGNHEAEFLDDPLNDKALASGPDGKGISLELQAARIDPKDVAAGKDAEGRGAWLNGLPFAVRIKKWFFSHGGNTDGDTIKKLSKRLEEGVDSPDGYGHKDVTGKNSILEAQEWWGGGRASQYADALGVKHMVFGHDPGALEDRGRIKASDNQNMVKLNVNMGLKNESKAVVGGALLHVHIVADGDDKAEALSEKGTETSLF